MVGNDVYLFLTGPEYSLSIPKTHPRAEGELWLGRLGIQAKHDATLFENPVTSASGPDCVKTSTVL